MEKDEVIELKKYLETKRMMPPPEELSRNKNGNFMVEECKPKRHFLFWKRETHDWDEHEGQMGGIYRICKKCGLHQVAESYIAGYDIFWAGDPKFKRFWRTIGIVNLKSFQFIKSEKQDEGIKHEK